jgi:hypothetical protein|tara:strand:- start:78 stop:488 length:411 start_codon:yes stop_codon:yes gene_type:complete
MSYEYLVMSQEEVDSLFPGLKDQPEPTLKQLLSEGLPLDENGKDTTNPMYGKAGPNKGRKFPEHSEWMKKNWVGKLNPRFGKPAWNSGLTGCNTGPKVGTYNHTEEAKEKMKKKIYCCGVGRNAGNHGKHILAVHG